MGSKEKQNGFKAPHRAVKDQSPRQTRVGPKNGWVSTERYFPGCGTSDTVVTVLHMAHNPDFS